MPHNLISAQESPLPLPKFQMAPRPKNSVSSGSKKGTRIYSPFFSESPGKRIPSRFPDDTDYVSGKINTIKETTEAVLVASREVYLEANNEKNEYRGADKSLPRFTSRCILFDEENISFDANLVFCIYKQC